MMGLLAHRWFCKFCGFATKSGEEKSKHWRTHIPEPFLAGRGTFWNIRSKEMFRECQVEMLDRDAGCKRSKWRGPGWYTIDTFSQYEENRIDGCYRVDVPFLVKRSPVGQLKKELKDLREKKADLTRKIAALEKTIDKMRRSR